MKLSGRREDNPRAYVCKVLGSVFGNILENFSNYETLWGDFIKIQLGRQLAVLLPVVMTLNCIPSANGRI